MAAAALAAEAAAQKALEKEKPAHKRTPKKLKLKQEAAADDSDSDAYTPTENEDQLQSELQNFAMDLLEDNPSWERRKIIQNLVIWEYVPVDPALIPPQALLVNPVLAAPPAPKPPGKRKGKKMRKHQSGLDFAKKKAPGKNSRCVSRATTPDMAVPEEVHDITYTLDHLLAETSRWVIDKSAGETILHRAAKMGYPDAAAYALDMAKMSPVMKDNAGIPPIHKAAFRGHADIVDYLLRYGADPNTNVKGTRPLHEALESGTLESVYHLLCYGSDPLLYDYSGNMPIDLAEENEEMLFYFSNLLNDLHGRKGDRWNVSHKPDFIMPKTDDESRPTSPSFSDFEFEVTNRLPPPFYLFSDREGRFILSADFKASTSIDVTTKNSSKLDVVEMSREDFLRLGRCGVLGVKPNPDVLKRERVVLVRLDAAAKRLLDRADRQHSASS
jgi:Ankyrin repeats (3 copies)